MFICRPAVKPLLRARLMSDIIYQEFFFVGDVFYCYKPLSADDNIADSRAHARWRVGRAEVLPGTWFQQAVRPTGTLLQVWQNLNIQNYIDFHLFGLYFANNIIYECGIRMEKSGFRAVTRLCEFPPQNNCPIAGCFHPNRGYYYVADTFSCTTSIHFCVALSLIIWRISFKHAQMINQDV